MISNLEYLLVGSNIAAYVMIGVALLRTRWVKLPENANLEQAFRILEQSLKQAYPELSQGYTWEEVLTKLKSSKAKIDTFEWLEIETLLKKYEAFRYGGVQYQNADPSSVLRLAQRLPRGERIAS